MTKLELPEIWQNKWTAANFQKPTVIQERVFPRLRAKESLVAISPTGSGKTLAYLLPLLLNVKKGEGNQLLILTSSQELAMQVAEVARDWGRLLELNIQSLIGGANVKRQIEKLKEKPEVLVGTPGRILELMKQKKIKSHLIQSVVMDEADQLVQKGTIELVGEVIRQLQKDVQMSFFSATADSAIDEIAALAQRELPEINVTAEDTSKGLTKHYYLHYPSRRKVDALRRLGHIDGFTGLIFFNQLADLGAAAEKLAFHGLPIASLASDQAKALRKLSLDQFREGKIRELLTTDVAARGLDIADLIYVVNADVPLTKESYLHRAGRVGRMGKDGVVITIVQENQMRDLKRLAKELQIQLQEIFLYNGKLETEKKTVEENEQKTVFENKLELHEKLHTKDPAKKSVKKKKRKNQKDKGKRR